MSRAVAAVHGQFGRAVIYRLNRPFNIHAHREGHLIFHLSGDNAGVLVSGAPCRATNESVVAISPWEPHNFVPKDLEDGSTFFVLYVNPDWFADGIGETRLQFGRAEFARTPALDARIRRVSGLVYAGERLTALECELRGLIQACYEETWETSGHEEAGAEEKTWRQRDLGERRGSSSQAIDFRVRKSMRLMEASLGANIELDAVARGAGLSRPHFYKLFRTQTGLTPNLYVKTLIMEHAIDRLVASEIAVADIGYDLGFSSQSGFTRFFAANVGMAPTQYRRVAHVL
ncbi:MAG TPA: AraC family transcriptional regulator [Roseiarcus sp.]|jgi:AraC-like DNA-binding protein